MAAKHLWHHAQYMALGRLSGAHGVLARSAARIVCELRLTHRHRIDSLTLYCPNAVGPHGFHTLGRTVESSLRSLNNLLERLHASYFFYLLPRPGKFIPVGNYLPSAILIGASITFGGFDIPNPVEGLLWLLPAAGVAVLGWILQTPLVSFLGLVLPRPGSRRLEKGVEGDDSTRRSMIGLVHLLYGAIIPTLAMVNFPQAILLALITLTFLAPYRPIRILGMAFHPYLLEKAGIDLRWEWEVVGNLSWVGVFAIWVPFSVVAVMI